MSSLLKAIKKFGFVNGTLLYRNLKKSQFKLPPDGHPIFMRKIFSDRYTFKETILNGQYDVDGLPAPENIIDAGANIGIASVFFARKYPKAKVFSVEPDPENFELLTRNTEKLGNVKLFNGGLWYKNVNLKVVDNDLGPRGFSTIEVAENEVGSVKAITISEIMKQEGFQTIDILKLDIEGAEKELFQQSYEDWLPRAKTIIIELHDRMNPGCTVSVFSALSKYKFSLYQVIDENLVFTNDDYIPLTDKELHYKK